MNPCERSTDASVSVVGGSSLVEAGIREARSRDDTRSNAKSRRVSPRGRGLMFDFCFVAMMVRSKRHRSGDLPIGSIYTVMKRRELSRLKCAPYMCVVSFTSTKKF